MPAAAAAAKPGANFTGATSVTAGLSIPIFVVMFLEIHPFQDGHGRLSRVMTTPLLIQAGYAHVRLKAAGKAIRLV